MNEENTVKKSEPDGCSCWSDRVPKYISSIGTLLIGIAALCGVQKAPEVANTIHAISILNQRQSHSMTINNHISPKVTKEVKGLIEEKPTIRLDQFILDRSKLPEGKVPKDTFFISPEYKEAASLELKKANTEVDKEAVLYEYYNKSVQSLRPDVMNGDNDIKLDQ